MLMTGGSSFILYADLIGIFTCQAVLKSGILQLLWPERADRGSCVGRDSLDRNQLTDM